MHVKTNILYVDDELENLKAFKSTLRRDFNVFLANSAEEALEVLRNSEIHILLSDQKMPEKSGIDLLQQVQDDYPDIIRMLISAYADYETAIESIHKADVFRFLTKPWDVEILKRAIIEGADLYRLKIDKQALFEQYLGLFNSNPTPSIIYAKDSKRVLRVNEAAIQLLSPIFDLKNALITSVFPILEQSGLGEDFGTNLETSQGQMIVGLRLKEIDYQDKKAILLSIENQSKRIEEALKKKSLITEIQQLEREKFSMELHDGIAQDIVLLKLCLERQAASKEHQKSNQECQSIIKELMNNIRALSYNLTPPSLSEGFIIAIENVLQKLQRVTNLNFKISIEDENCETFLKNINQDVSYDIFRICQEFINNAITHGETEKIEILIDQQDQQYVLTILDTGNGFDINQIEKGSGLKNMKKRADLHEIDFELVSVKENGTKLKLTFPKSLFN